MQSRPAAFLKKIHRRLEKKEREHAYFNRTIIESTHFRLNLFSSVQFKVISLRSEKPICAPPPSLGSFLNVAFETVNPLLRQNDDTETKDDKNGIPSTCLSVGEEDGLETNSAGASASLVTVSAAILCPTVCVNDVISKVGMCGISSKYVTSQPYSALLQ